MITIADPDTMLDISGTQPLKIFLAGGISGCPDWQSEMLGKLASSAALENIPIVIFNPRRENFPIHDPTAAKFQIAWEFERLHEADIISFWFPCETICPIVLYELGFWNHSSKPIVVGVHPNYQRKQDVKIQTGLVRPEIEVVEDFQRLTDELIKIVVKR